MRRGTAHPVPLIIGTNAEEARLFTRFIKLLPTNESMVEALLAGVEPAQRARITAAYPDYPKSSGVHPVSEVTSPSASAAWQIAEAHSRHAPTYLYRYDYAPRTLQLVGLRRHSRHRAARRIRLLPQPVRVRCSPRPPTSGPRCGSATTCRPAGASSAVLVCRATTGRRYTDSDRAVMVFDRRPRVVYDPHADRRVAWEGFTLAER